MPKSIPRLVLDKVRVLLLCGGSSKLLKLVLASCCRNMGEREKRGSESVTIWIWLVLGGGGEREMV